MPGVLVSFGDQLEALAAKAEKTSARIVAAAKSAENATSSVEDRAPGTSSGMSGGGRASSWGKDPATKTLEKFASELGASVR